jgi:hypothetical protein
MGHWSARSDAWARWEQAGVPGSARHVNNFGNTSPLPLGARTVRCHDGARACDQTPHKYPSHTRCGSMPCEPMLPNCIIRFFTVPGRANRLGSSGYAGIRCVDLSLHLLSFPKTARFRSYRPLSRVHVA